MGRRLTALEFNEWYVYMAREDLMPEDDRVRHGQLIAAGHNGGDLRPRGAGRPWVARDFIEVDVWSSIEEHAAELPLAQQIAEMNRRFE